jgi:hypothetical protein
MEPLLSAQEAMRILGVGRSFCTEHRHELGGVKVGRLLKFSRAGLMAYIARRQLRANVPTVQETPAPKRPTAFRLPKGINPVTGRAYGTRAS